MVGLGRHPCGRALCDALFMQYARSTLKTRKHKHLSRGFMLFMLLLCCLCWLPAANTARARSPRSTRMLAFFLLCSCVHASGGAGGFLSRASWLRKSLLVPPVAFGILEAYSRAPPLIPPTEAPPPPLPLHRACIGACPALSGARRNRPPLSGRGLCRTLRRRSNAGA